MFSKKARKVAAPPPPSGAERAVAQVRAALALPLTHPLVGAVGATFLLLGSAVALIALAGDPNAGAPQVRIKIGGIGALSPPGWKEALLHASPVGGLTTDTFRLFDGEPSAETPITGEATITLPAGAAAGPLPPAPIPGLTEPGPGGSLLPIIAPDGRSAAQAYARPFVSNGRPKVALVVGGLGLNPRYTRQAIEQLPPEITLSFVPYRDDLQSWIDLARANGHEVLLEAPMEPNDYPENDPGPFTLMAAGQPQETAKRTEWLLSRATGYFGLTNYLGSKFVTSDAGMNAFTATLRSRGVAFIDDGLAAKRGGGLLRASADRVIDDELSAEAIDARLAELESTASKKGQALGSGFSYPVTLTQVAAWAQRVQQRGYQLAPASAVMSRR